MTKNKSLGNLHCGLARTSAGLRQSTNCAPQRKAAPTKMDRRDAISLGLNMWNPRKIPGGVYVDLVVAGHRSDSKKSKKNIR